MVTTFVGGVSPFAQVNKTVPPTTVRKKVYTKVKVPNPLTEVVFTHVAENPGCYASIIALHLGQRPESIVRILLGLYKSGRVSRRSGVKGGGRVFMYCTPSAEDEIAPKMTPEQVDAMYKLRLRGWPWGKLEIKFKQSRKSLHDAINKVGAYQ